MADAKNLKRSVAMVLQYAEYGLPMVLDLNMVDESSARGIRIDTQALSRLLGIHVVETVANDGIGVERLKSGLKQARSAATTVSYPKEIEEYISLVEKLIAVPGPVSKRSIALLLLAGDPCVDSYLMETCGESRLNQLKHLAGEVRHLAAYVMEIFLENLYHREAEAIVSQVQTVDPPSKNPFILTLGDWSTQISTPARFCKI